MRQEYGHPRRGLWGIAGVAVLLTVLAGCAAGPRTELAQRAQTSMVGMPKANLLACAGVPARQASAGGNEYYTYVAPPSYAGGPSTSVGIGGGSGGSGVGVGIGLGIPLFSGGSDGCEATVMLTNDRVQRVTYPAGASLPSCADLVQNCVPP